ncbi:MAG: ABC transporter permease [Planctomycetales bacterium]|nr:ABC transporter permease [bacterium]UNM07175.1 MAG: ABC transporter permease [Planctomycetales bacterium]
MQRILSICATSLRIWARQPVAVMVSLLVPVVVMTVFGFVFGGMGGGGGDSSPVRAIFVDEDGSEASTALRDALLALDGLTLLATYSDEAGNEVPYTRELALQRIRDGKTGLAIVVPAGYGTQLEQMDFNENRAEIELLSDSSLQIDNAILQGMLMQATFMTAGNSVASTGMQFMGEDLGMDPATVAMMQDWMDSNAQWGPSGAGTVTGDGETEDTGSGGMQGFVDIKVTDVLGEAKENPVFSHQVAGVLTMFMLFTVAASGGSLLRERQNGTIRRIMISATKPVHYLLGKYLAFFLIAYLQTWVMLLAGWLVFKVDIITPLPSLAVFGALVALAATSFGIVLASVCRSVEQVSSISTLVILVMSSIGGSMMPRQFMPAVMQKLGNFTFNGWAMEGFTGIFWYGKDLSGILLPCAVMLGLAVALFLLAARLFSSKLAY